MITKPKVRKINGEWHVEAHRVRQSSAGFWAGPGLTIPLIIEAPALRFGPFLTHSLALRGAGNILQGYGPIYKEEI